MKVISRPATASPRTNLAAPSMEPKKVLSSSSSRRRRRASSSSMRPDDRSASMAICLPGMASRVKRADTSAMRPEPLVMTTKFTITRMEKTIMPMMKLPPMTKPPKASITLPAAWVPSCPWARIRRVDARFRDKRTMVANKRTVGNELNSRGLWMNSAVIRISTEKVMENARLTSISQRGRGRINTTRMAATANAMAMSPRRMPAWIHSRTGKSGVSAAFAGTVCPVSAIVCGSAQTPIMPTAGHPLRAPAPQSPARRTV